MNASNSVRVLKWRECLKKHFGAPSSRKWYRLYADVVCVLLGLKPALLVDYIPTDGPKFGSFLQDVLGNESILTAAHSPKLCVFQLGDDTVLSNVEYLGLTPECSGGTSVQYVDIAKDMRQPCVLPLEAAKAREEEYLKWCGTVKERLNKQEAVDGSRDKLYIPMVRGESSDFKCQNLCTLFGRLLGYPVVYWFEPEKSYSLDMVDLVCYSVAICSVGDPTAAKYFLNQV